MVGVGRTATHALSTHRGGADGAGSDALLIVLELAGSAGSSGLADTIEGLVAVEAVDAEVGVETGLAVG